jgi:uncharacterized phage protein (TIGR01671 family)
MRTIKFRAWSNLKKEMIQNPPLKYNYGKWFMEYADTIMDDIVLMQFTGLFDRNGKEVYEGDIIAYKESVMSDTGEDKPNYIEKRTDRQFEYLDGQIGERRYGREVKTVRWEDKSCGFEPFSDSEENCRHCGGGDSPNNCEVIGNIFENSDLLK